MEKTIAQTPPVKPLQAAILTLYADLLQQLEASTEIVGSIRTQKIKGKEYLKANTTVGTGRKTIYLGSAMAPETQQRAEAIRQEMERAKARRQLISLLRRSGLPGPNAEFGRVLEVAASAGLFRSGVTLIGTAAYQSYPALVGAILPAASLVTQDIDLGIASLAISLEQEAGGASLEEILRRADPTFRGAPALSDPAAPPSNFRSKSGLLVQVVTQVRTRNDTNPMPVPGLRAGAAPLQHLRWLVQDPIPAAVLYGAGVLVRVPQPARYAVHKLILAQKRRAEPAKRLKDLVQAKSLIEALSLSDPYAIPDQLKDARNRGPGWRQSIERSLDEIGLSLNETKV
jgi:hypothetical protein